RCARWHRAVALMSGGAQHDRSEIQQTINRWKWSDTIFRMRTRDVLRKTGLHLHLPREGRLLDIGSGLGHIAEAVMKDAPGRPCVMVDPVTHITPYVVRRLAPRPCHATRPTG